MRRLLTALIAIAIFISCGRQGSQTSEPPDTVGAESLASTQATPHRLSSIISREEAAKLISAFLNHPKLGPYGVDKNLGGIFEKSVFDLDDTRAGSLLWFCYNTKEPVEKQWYLAASKVTGYTPAVTREASDDLWKPYDYFKYTGSSTGIPEVLKFIESHQYGAPGKSPLVPQAEVRIQVEDFMQILLPTFDPDPARLQKYSFSFFGEMSEDFQIRKLLAQPGVAGVRYYFGYEEKDEYGMEINNKIRVILVAIDQYGNNVLGDRGDDDDIMIQRSFPPPPQSDI